MVFRILFLLYAAMVSSTSWAEGTSACSMDDLEPDEICMASNPASKHLSLRQLDIDEMKGFDNLDSEEQAELIAQVNSHNKTRTKIDNLHRKLGEMLFSSFVVIVLFVISSGSSLGEFFRAGKQTKGADGLIVGLFFFVCLGAAFDARNGGFAAREFRDMVEIKLEKIRQYLTYESIKGVRTDNSLDEADFQASIDKQAELEEGKINFSLDISRFMLNAQTSYYRTNAIILEHEMEYLPETSEELASDLTVLTADMVKPVYSSIEFTEMQYDTPLNTGEDYQAVGQSEYTNTTKYISGVEIKDSEEKTYGKAVFEVIELTDEFMLKSIDFNGFVEAIRSGSDFKSAAEPALSGLVDELKNDSGDLSNEAKKVVLSGALYLAKIAKSEIAYEELVSMIDPINSAILDGMDAHCIDIPDSVKASKDYIDNPIINPKSYSCLGNSGGSIKVLGLDRTGNVYDAKSIEGDKQSHQDELIGKFRDKIIGIESSSMTKMSALYKSFIDYQRDVLKIKENEDFYVSRGGAQFGGFLSEKIMDSNFDYALELQTPLNLKSMGDEYYLILKDEAELKRIAPDLHLQKEAMLNKNFFGEALSNISPHIEGQQFTYEKMNNQQMNNKLSQDVSVVQATNSGGLSLMVNLFDRMVNGMSAIYKFGDEDENEANQVFRTPMAAFKETIKDSKGMVESSLTSVGYSLMGSMVVQGATSFTLNDSTGIRDGSGKSAAVKNSLGVVNSIAKFSTNVLLFLFVALSGLLIVLTFIIKVVLEAPNLIFGFFSLSILVASIQLMIFPYIMGLFAFVGFSKGEKVRQMKLTGLFLVMGFMFVTGAFLVAAIGMLLYNPMVMILSLGSELIYSNIQSSFAAGGTLLGFVGMAVGVVIVVASSLGYLLVIMRFFWQIVSKIIADVPQFDNQVDLFSQISKDIDKVGNIEQALFIIKGKNITGIYGQAKEMENSIQKATAKTMNKVGNKVGDLADKMHDKINKSDSAADSSSRDSDVSSNDADSAAKKD